MMRRLAAAIAVAALSLVGTAHAEDASNDARVAAFAKLPYWPGYWVSEQFDGTTITGVAPPRDPSLPPLQRLNGNDAPWNEEGKRRQAEDAKTRGRRGALGWGYPMMMDAATPFQVMITPEETLIVNAYGETRHIYTDGRDFPAPEDMWPTVWGTSIGHWEGDTLVVDTIGVQSPVVYFHSALTLSDDAKYHETLEMVGDKLRMTMTIEDPTTLTEPWHRTINYVRETSFDRMIQMDFSNDRTDYSDGVGTIEPPKD
ncbi:hypothetical protein [Croceibacterium aestuarii]|uniref:hypothetical protein n=1 Tax=Croceibacterium aestuarii TaxID=3064139 RepID=UPI00272E7CCC|nr:hypothetical protein [Croceibacterium sp. D39]